MEQVTSIMRGYSFYSDNGFLLRVFTKGFYYQILIMTCSKLAVFNKAIRGAFLSLKRHIFI